MYLIMILTQTLEEVKKLISTFNFKFHICKMKLNDLFEEIPSINLSESICHSGGALGSDTIWEEYGSEYGVTTKAYSYKTPHHNSDSKVEISDEDYEEGVKEINKANYRLNRFGIHKYMNLLARNWSQVKYSDQLFAIGNIVNPKEKGSRYYNKSKYQVIEGGTGYAVQMAIDNDREVFVFDQLKNNWYNWSYNNNHFTKCETPYITKLNFCGIGTRAINEDGVQAIRDVYEKTKGKYLNK